MLVTLFASLVLGLNDARLETQHLQVTLDPASHEIIVVAEMRVIGEGEIRLQLHESARDLQFQSESGSAGYSIKPSPEPGGLQEITLLHKSDAPEMMTLTYRAHFEQDVQATEVEGQIHNQSVSAHLGEDGLFLSDGSAWHPQWIDENGHHRLMSITIDVEPLDGWAIVCSGEPATHQRNLQEPIWSWKTPRPVDGMAIVGNRHIIRGESHRTLHGTVDIVMHIPEAHEQFAALYLEATKSYLDLYVPLLGPFPYRRFSIVENFFSSGFAYPGFTLLGPQVVGMAPRSLEPGYLDHELIHNWWGNGVYVDPEDGNWCEALTSYCANYFRRIAEHGEGAGRAYRRGILMKLSTDPKAFDDGPLGLFSRAGGPGRFVGYDKGAFVFSMLEGGGPYVPVDDERAKMFRGLRLFAREYMGRYAGWDDLRDILAREFDLPLDEFFERWVRQAKLPGTELASRKNGVDRFSEQYGGNLGAKILSRGEVDGRPWLEVDPEFKLYRVLPPEQLIPTISGTFGPGGVMALTNENRDEVSRYMSRVNHEESGENALLIGAGAIKHFVAQIEKTANPIMLGDGSFTIDGTKYDQPGQAVLHTMAHPERPGRFITVFHANTDEGWSRLRLINFYTRDTTIVWDMGKVIHREVFEPDRRIWPRSR